jgi:hypothetical protein
MASPITTSGFGVNVMPGINYLDPRMMAPAYGSIIPAAAQGMGAAGDFFNMQENAQARPLRQQLAQIQLQEAQNRLAMAPLEQQLAALRLGEAQQRAAVPQFITENVDIVGGGRELRAADPNATFENFQITEEFTPRQRVTRGQEVLAGGVVRPGERRETLASAAQVAAEAEKQAADNAYRKALTVAKGEPKQFESTRLIELIDAATASGDAEAAQMYRARLDRINAQPGLLQPGVTAGRRLETIGTNAGFTTDEINALGETSDGINAMIKIGQKNALLAKGEILIPRDLDLTAQEQAAVRSVRGGQRKSTGSGVPPVGSANPEMDEVFGVGATPSADNFVVGRTYTDANGNTATYIGNGRWQENK